MSPHSARLVHTVSVRYRSTLRCDDPMTNVNGIEMLSRMTYVTYAVLQVLLFHFYSFVAVLNIVDQFVFVPTLSLFTSITISERSPNTQYEAFIRPVSNTANGSQKEQRFTVDTLAKKTAFRLIF